MQPGDKEEDQGLGEGCEEDDTRDRFETWKVERKELALTLNQPGPVLLLVRSMMVDTVVVTMVEMWSSNASLGSYSGGHPPYVWGVYHHIGE